MSRVAFAAVVAGVLAAATAPAQVAVRGEQVHTVSGGVIENGVVVIEAGRITAVGPAAGVTVPPGLRVLEARVVTPGLVDAHSTVGLSGAMNIPHDQDQRDRSEAIQPELRAVDAFNVRDPLVDWVRRLGVTTVHTGHAPGAAVSGQTLVAKTYGRTVEDAVLVRTAMVAATLGSGATNPDHDKAPGTRAKVVAMLRQELVKAGEYRRKADAKDPKDRPERDLRMETLAAVLAGDVPLLVTVHRSQDILAALRLAEEFRFRLVLDGCAEAHLVLDELRAAKVPVIVHPTMYRAGSTGSVTENISFETPAKLHEAGIPFALQSGYESYVPKTRVVLFEAAQAAAFGLPRDAALAAVTLDAARVIGVADRVGSLEVGKDGDVALWDGDPFEWTSHCTGVVVRGVVTDEGAR